MAAVCAPPDGARGYALRHSMIPRPATTRGAKRDAADAETSPKSVIADVRFVSPGSSSSSSIEHRSLPDATHLLHKAQLPRYNGRCGSYSTSDGELSDPDSVTTSRELNKVGNSGPLESLPETEAANTDHGLNPPCRIPLFPAANGLEATALYVLADRTNDSGRAAPHSAAALRTEKNHPVDRGVFTKASREVKCEERIVEPISPEQELGSASARRFTASEGGVRRREYGVRPTFSAELSSSGKPLEARSMGPGAAANFGYSGTPMRFVPGWQGPVSGAHHVYSPSTRVEKGPTTYNLTPSSSDTGLRLQHRFHSGPIMGSMIPKPPPSKWDDADKWIVSPNRKESPTQPQRSLQSLLTGRRHSMAGGQSDRPHLSPDYAVSAEFQSAFINAGKMDVQKRGGTQKKRSKALSFSDISQKVETPRAISKSPQPVKREARAKSSSVAPEKQPSDKSSKTNELPLLQHEVVAENKQSAVPDESQVKPTEEPTKDMATQVTPVESLKNSTCTTPGLAPSPTRHCNTPAGRRASSLGAMPAVAELLQLQGCHLAKLELRQLAGDESLKRKSVWTTREEEEMESSASLREESSEEVELGQAGTRASAWEEAERSKALVRFQSKEAKIKAWEQHQRAQAEADMKKVEAKVAKMLADAAEKMKEKSASTAKKAAAMRAAAESKRSHQAAKIAGRAELMRKAGILSPAASSSKAALFRSCFRT